MYANFTRSGHKALGVGVLDSTSWQLWVVAHLISETFSRSSGLYAGQLTDAVGSKIPTP